MRIDWRRPAEGLLETAPALEWSLVLFRVAAGPVLAALAVVSRNVLPYWEAVIVAAGVLTIVNLALLPALRKKLYLAVAAVGSMVDTALVLAVSSLAIRASAKEPSTSDMWLIFPLVIVAAAHRFKAAFSLAYVALLGTWYAAHVALLFDPGTRALRELPIRVAFFALIGLLATALSYSLRRGRSTKGGEGDS